MKSVTPKFVFWVLTGYQKEHNETCRTSKEQFGIHPDFLLNVIPGDES